MLRVVVCLIRSGGARRFFFFFFNDTATTEIYTLSLHDALPIFRATGLPSTSCSGVYSRCVFWSTATVCTACWTRSEEHTSELQSQSNLVCRLLLEKKKKIFNILTTTPPATDSLST